MLGERVQGGMRELGLVLLVEDSEDDLVFFRLAASKLRIQFQTQMLKDGQEAINEGRVNIEAGLKIEGESIFCS